MTGQLQAADLQKAAATPNSNGASNGEVDLQRQERYACSFVGRPLTDDDIPPLQQLLHEGQTRMTRTWAALALGRGGAGVAPDLVRVLEAHRPSTDGEKVRNAEESFLGTVLRSLAKLPGAVAHLPLIYEFYGDEGTIRSLRYAAGEAVAAAVSDPSISLDDPVLQQLGVTSRPGESNVTALLRSMLDEWVHDGCVAAAAKAISQRSRGEIEPVADALREAAEKVKHSESVQKAVTAAIAKL